MVKQQNGDKWALRWPQIILLFFYAALPFMYNSAGVDPSLIPRQIGACILVCVFGCWMFWQQKNKPVEVSFIPLVLLLLVVAYVISYIQAINKIESFYIILKIGLFASIGWVMYVLAKREVLTLQFISFIVSVTGIVATVMTIGNMVLLQSKGVHIFESDNMYMVNVTFGHKNLLSSFLFVCLPMIVVQVVLTTKTSWRIILVTMGIALSGVLVLLQTRAVLLALGVCFAAACLLLSFGFKQQLSVWQKRFSILFIVAGLLLTAAVFYKYRDKLTLLTRTESFKERKNLWDNTWQMIAEHPITGVGAANWQIHFPKYGMQKFYEVNYTISEGLTNFQRPHNDFLWVWAESGLLGFACYVFIFIATLVCACRLLSREEKVSVKIGYAMVFLQLLGFMVISAVDFPWERIEHPAIIFLSVGFIAARHETIQQWKGISVKRWVWLIPVSMGLLSIYICAQRWQSELQLRKMYKAHAAGNWQKLVTEGKKAETAMFNMDYYSIPVQWYIGVGYFMQNNLVEAKRCFEAAYQLHPYQVHVLNNYGTCYEKEGDHTKAIELLEESHRLSPTFSDGIINLSGAYFNAGRYDDAYNTITKFRYDEQNERFKTFALAIIKVKLDDIISKEKTTPFATYLTKVVSDDQAILAAYRKAEVIRVSLLQCLLEDSL
ncbi:MAG: O-antigen ligase family protein [Bacteroidota bacterium]